MKMKLLKNVNKAYLPVFKKSLYFEGLRQLRIGGIVLAALVALGTAREYLGNISFRGEDDYPLRYCLTQTLPSVFSDTAWLVFFLCALFAVIAAFLLTSFTRSAKARDFYYATPHSSGTLWLNFAAACLTWTAAGVLAFFIVSCAFLMPFDPKLLGICMMIAFNVLAAVFMVFAMAMLAISITGRLLNAIVNFVGFSVLSTLVKIAFSQGYNGILSRFCFVVPSSELCEYDPVHHIYRRFFFSDALSELNESNPHFAILASWHSIGYCLLVGCVMLVAAAVFMSIRTGDAAGRPFVNGAAHILSLTVDYLLIADLLDYLVAEMINYISRYGFGNLFDGSSVIAALTLALIVFGGFWGMELLLTFDVRHAHRAFKLMPVPVLIPFVVMLYGSLLYQAEFNTVPAADEVESFTLVRNDTLPEELVMFRLRDTFGRWVTDEADIRDRDIIDYATTQIRELSDKYGHEMEKAATASSIYTYDSLNSYDKSVPLIALRLNLKNGGHITRMISFDSTHVKALQNALLSDSAFMKKFLTLPAADAVNVRLETTHGLTGEETAAIYKSFLEEYNALPDEKKLDIVRASMDFDNYAEKDAFDEEAVTTAYEDVSASDVSLISRSKAAGTYGIVNSNYLAGGSDFISIEINGYPEGHLYEYEKWFDQVFTLSTDAFPQTASLVVRTCNAKFDGAQSHFKESAENANKTDGYYGAMDLSVHYLDRNRSLYVEYIYLTGSKLDESLLNYPGKKAEEYYDEEETRPEITEIEVDSDAMARQLFKDIQATQTIDFTKPCCRVTWHNYGVKDFPEYMTFYAQTDFPDVAK